MERSKKGIRAIIVTAIFAIICSIIGVTFIKPDFIGPIGSTMIVSFIYAKIIMAMVFTQGWKVFNRKTILGMPVILFTFYILLGAILFSLYVTTKYAGPDLANSVKNILSLVITASSALIGTFCAWHIGVREWMAAGSEYDARMQFKNKGYTDPVIEQKITELKNLNIIS